MYIYIYIFIGNRSWIPLYPCVCYTHTHTHTHTHLAHTPKQNGHGGSSNSLSFSVDVSKGTNSPADQLFGSPAPLMEPRLPLFSGLGTAFAPTVTASSTWNGIVPVPAGPVGGSSSLFTQPALFKQMVYTHVCMYVFMYIYIYIWCVYLHMYVCKYFMHRIFAVELCAFRVATLVAPLLSSRLSLPCLRILNHWFDQFVQVN
jgi:hypothetical protein